jgi:hypothetical protein
VTLYRVGLLLSLKIKILKIYNRDCSNLLHQLKENMGQDIDLLTRRKIDLNLQEMSLEKVMILRKKYQMKLEKVRNLKKQSQERIQKKV